MQPAATRSWNDFSVESPGAQRRQSLPIDCRSQISQRGRYGVVYFTHRRTAMPFQAFMTTTNVQGCAERDRNALTMMGTTLGARDRASA
jgi:hypothetical protein